MAITQTARDMRAKGRDVISLSAGEPDFDTPQHIRDAAVEAMNSGKTRYTAVDGIPELKDAIIQKFARDNQLKYTAGQINVSPGGKPVISNAFAVTVGAGDEVIIPAPCWVSYPDMVKLCGGLPIIVPCGSETGFKLTADALGAAITPKTKWLMLNSPSNPTGAAYTANELSALAEVLRANPHILILTDDIYEHLVYDDFSFTTIAQVAPDLFDRTLTMNGVSKAYAMYEGRRNRIVSRLNDMANISCLTPPGAFYAFADISKIVDDDAAFALQLLEDAHVNTARIGRFQLSQRFLYAV